MPPLHCTVFGLDKSELKGLQVDAGLEMDDKHKSEQGYEVNTSAYKVRTLKHYVRTFGV
jgi:hypothetical protein